MTYSPPCGLLIQQGCVSCRVICLNHVDRECVILARISKAVRDVGLCLAVAADVVYIEIEKVIIVLQQRLICSAQEVIRRVVDIKPYLLGRVLGSIQLVGNRSVSLGSIREVLIVVCCNCYVQSIVGTSVSIISVNIVCKYVASLICCADTCININTVKSIAQCAECQISLYVRMLGNSSAVAVRDCRNRVAVCVITETTISI